MSLLQTGFVFSPASQFAVAIGGHILSLLISLWHINLLRFPHSSLQTGVILPAASICAASMTTYNLENNVWEIKHKGEHLHKKKQPLPRSIFFIFFLAYSFRMRTKSYCSLQIGLLRQSRPTSGGVLAIWHTGTHIGGQVDSQKQFHKIFTGSPAQSVSLVALSVCLCHTKYPTTTTTTGQSEQIRSFPVQPYLPSSIMIQ